MMDWYWPAIIFLVAVTAGCIYLATQEDGQKPVDPQSVPNSEYLHSLGIADNVLPGCAWWPGETTGMKMVLYFGKGDDVRITAVCVPK